VDVRCHPPLSISSYRKRSLYVDLSRKIPIPTSSSLLYSANSAPLFYIYTAVVSASQLPFRLVPPVTILSMQSISIPLSSVRWMRAYLFIHSFFFLSISMFETVQFGDNLGWLTPLFFSRLLHYNSQTLASYHTILGRYRKG